MPNEKIGRVSLRKGGIYHVYVTYFQSPAKFWIQLATAVEQLDAIHDGIALYHGSSAVQKLDRVDVGSVCLAKYVGGEEECYYRAQICNIENPTQCEVFFIDYGNSDTVSTTEILYLPLEFSTLEAQAVECSLSGASSHTSDLDKLLECENLYAKILSVTDDGLHIVDLSMSPDSFKGAFDSAVHANSTMTVQSSFSPLQFNMGKYADVCISYVEDDGSFYCQLLENARKLDELMFDLQRSYGPNSAYITQPMPGIPCIVFEPLEKIYYRAQVLSTSGNSNEVRYVDFGIPNIAPVSCLRQLSEEHILLPMQAIRCTLANAENLPTQRVVTLLHKYKSKKGLVAKVVLKTNKSYDMELIDTSSGDDVQLTDILKGSSKAIDLDTSYVSRPSLVKRAVEPADARLHTEEKIFVTSIISDFEFFGQLTRYSPDTLEDFQNQLNETYQSGGQPLPNPTVEDVCCTQFSDDCAFYRAQILAIQNGRAQVRFLDYGNQEVKNLSELYVLNPAFYSLPQQGILCSLSGGYSGLTKNKLTEVLEEQEIVVQLDAKQGYFFKVKVPENVENASIVSKLASCKIKSRALSQTSGVSSISNSQKMDDLEYVKPELESGQWEEVVITHVEDPENFYCQLTGSAAQLDDLMDRIEAFCGSLGPSDDNMGRVGLGLPCLAKYSEDHTWYRGIITGVKANGDAEVQFVDYGNREVMSRGSMKAIIPEFMKLPIQSVVCSLNGVHCSENSMWEAPQVNQFYEMATKDTVIFHITQFDDIEETYSVDLFEGQDCINEMFGRATGLLSARYKAPPRPRQVGVQPSPASLEAIKEPDAHMQTESNKQVGGYGNERPPRIQNDHRDQPRGFRGDSPSSNRSGSVPRDGPPRHSGKNREQRTPPHGEGSNWATWNKSGSSPQMSGMVQYKFQHFHENDYVDVYVSYMEHPGRFWCQLEKSSTQLEQLMADINNLYSTQEANMGRLRTCTVAQPCVTKFTEDDQWYRSRVMEVNGNQICVQFVDYGNEEQKDKDQLMELKEKFSHLPVQSFECTLAEVQPIGPNWSEEAITQFEAMTSSNKLVAGIVGIREDMVCVVELVDVSKLNHPSLKEELIRLGHAKDSGPEVEYQPKAVPKLPAIANINRSRRSSASSGTSGSSQPRGRKDVTGRMSDVKITKNILDVGCKKEVGMAHVNNPSRFWVQASEFAPVLDDLMGKLSTDYNNLNHNELRINQPKLGILCVARFSEDDEWYRAEVVGIERSSMRVKFVDYGNGEWLTPDKVRVMRKEYAELPAQAIECSLDGIRPLQGTWTEDVNSRFEDMAYDEKVKLVAQVVSVTKDHIHKIRLADVSSGREIDYAATLVKMGVAEQGQAERGQGKQKRGTPPRTAGSMEPGPVQKYKSLVIEPGQSFIGGIVWVNSPLDFYIHTSKSQRQLEPMMEALFEHYQCVKLNEDEIVQAKAGQPCIAPFDEDGGWYRATIMATRGTEAKVLFVDYGNKQIVPISKLKQIKSEYLQLPVQALRCSLIGIDEPPEWNQKVKAIFERLLNQELQVTLMSCQNDICLVSLQTKEGREITDELIRLGVPEKPGRQQKTPPRPTGRAQQSRGSPASQGSRDGFSSRGPDRSGREGQSKSCGDRPSQGSRENRGQQPKGYGGDRSSVGIGDNRSKGFGDNRSPQGPRGIGDNRKMGQSMQQKEDGDWGESVMSSKSVTPISSPARPILTAVRSVSSPTKPPSQSIKVGYKNLLGEMQTGTTADVTVCFTESPTKICVQLTKYITALDELYAKLSDHYMALGPDDQRQTQPEVNRRCVAKFTEDDYYYRGIITKTISSAEVEVLFVDYGNTQVTSVDKLKTLHPKFADLPIQALECRLSGVTSTSPEAIAKLTEMIDNKAFNAHINGIEGGVLEVNLLTQPDGIDVNSIMIAEFGASPLSAQDTVMASAYPPPSLPIRTAVSVYPTHVETPGCFYVQLADSEDAVVELADNLLAEYGSLGDTERQLTGATIGSPCISKYSEDQAWYRAILTNLTADSATVRFVDYGNCDTVPVTNLKAVTEDYLTKPVQGIPCYLHGLPQSGWSVESVNKFEEIVNAEDAELTAEFMDTTLPVSVRLINKGEDLAAIFDVKQRETAGQVHDVTKTNASKYPEPTLPSGSVEAYLSSMDMPDLFYVQLAGTEDELCGLADAVTSHYSSLGDQDLAMDSASVGDICCSLFSEDDSWYRGVVESVTGDEAEIRFVDYGNKQTTKISTLKQVLPEFVNKPPYALRCELYNVSVPSGGWTTEAIDKFTALTEDVLHLEFQGGKPTCQITIQANDKNVNEEMAQFSGTIPERSSGAANTNKARTTTEVASVQNHYPQQVLPSGGVEAYLSSMDMPDLFYLQIVGTEDELCGLADAVTSHYSSLEDRDLVMESVSVGDICCSLFSEDDSWYRGVVESVTGDEAEIRFVDYGNKQTTKISTLKLVIPEFVNKPPYALRCELYNVPVPSGGWTTEAVDKFASLTEDVLHVEFKNDKETYQVILCSSETNINTEISKFGAIQSSQINANQGINNIIAAEQLTSKSVDKYTINGVPNQPESVIISHVDSLDSFYIQLTHQLEELEEYSTQLNEELTAMGEAGNMLENCVVGQPCCAIFSEDSHWYRGLIEGLPSEGKASVRFVDYGNTDESSTDKLKSVSRAHLDVPPYAIRCKLAGHEPTASSENIVADFRSRTEDQELTATFQSSESEPYEISLTLDGVDLRDQFCVNQQSLQQQDSCDATSGIAAPSYKSLILPAQTDVVVSHVNSPVSFYIQQASLIDEIAEYQETLNEEYSAQSDGDRRLTDVKVNQLCCALYSEDNIYYRAKILEISDHDSCNVLFVDFGNEDVVTTDKIREITKEHLQKPLYGIHCRLGGIEERTWTDEECDQFLNVVSDEELVCNILSQSVPCEVDLTIKKDGSSIKEKFLCQKDVPEVAREEEIAPKKEIETEQGIILSEEVKEISSQLESEKERNQESNDGEITKDVTEESGETSETDSAALIGQAESSESEPLATYSPPVIPSDSTDAVVVHINSLTSFYVQPETNTDALDEMMEKLRATYGESSQKLVDFNIGSPCVAWYSEDNDWYRAKVVDISTDGVEVHFVDYGNKEVKESGDLYKLEEEFLSHPPFIIHCKLAGIQSDSQTDLSEKFTNTAQDKTYHVRFLGDSEPCEVEVMEDNVSILDQMRATSGADDANGKDDQEDSPSMGGSQDGHTQSDVGTTSPHHEQSSHKQCDQPQQSAQEEDGKFCTPSLVVGEECAVTVTHSESPSQFWVQLSAQKDIIEQLGQDLDQYYSIEREMVQNIELCAAKFIDGRWYRSRVKAVMDEVVTVYFYDFGNTDEIPLGDLRELDEQFCQLPPQAIECILEGVQAPDGTWTDEIAHQFEDMVMDKPMTAEVKQEEQSMTDKIYVVQLVDDGIRVSQKLLDNNLARSSEQKEYPCSVINKNNNAQIENTENEEISQTAIQLHCETVECSDQLGKLDLALNSKIEVMVSHTETPSLFYVHLKKNVDMIAENDEDLQEAYKDSEADDTFVQTLEEKMFGVAKSSEDERWYRAVITKKLPENQFIVDYIDYGNSETVDSTNIRPLQTNFVTMACQAIPCCITGIHCVEGSWSDEAIDVFIEETTDKILIAEASKKERTVHVVKLLDMGISVAQKLVKAGFATEKVQPKTAEVSVENRDIRYFDADLKENEFMDMYVTNIETPYNFHCQLSKSSTTDLPLLMDQIQDSCSSLTEVSDPHVGMPCIAQYQDDWYRAEMIHKLEDNIEVSFVDYGNCEVVTKSEVKTINSDLIELPVQSFQCSLFGVKPVTEDGNFDEPSCARFEELVNNKELSGKILSIERGDNQRIKFCMIELFEGENNIAHTLIDAGYAQSTEPGVHLQSPKEQPRVKDDINPKFELEEVVPVFYTKGGKPDDFICQMAKTSEQLDTLMEEIAEKAKSSPDTMVEELVVGKMYLAQYSQDKAWYRAVISTIHPEGICEVLYLDFGNVEKIPRDELLCRLQPLDSSQAQLPAQAISCKLAGVETQEWSKEATRAFEELCGEVILSARIVGESVTGNQLRPLYKVYLYDTTLSSGESINYQMVSKGHAWLSPVSELNLEADDLDGMAEHQEQLENGFHEVSMSHSNSLGDLGDGMEDGDQEVTYSHLTLHPGEELNMYVQSAADPDNILCQPVSSADFLSTLMENIQEYYNKEGEESASAVSVGQACVAKFSEDERWYRAQVVSINEDKVDVYYVDYGNTEQVDKHLIKPLAHIFSQLPVQTVRCSVSNIKPDSDTWVAEAGVELEKACCEESEQVTVKVVSVDDDNRIEAAITTGAGVDLRQMLLDKKYGYYSESRQEGEEGSGTDTLTTEVQSASQPQPDTIKQAAAGPVVKSFPSILLEANQKFEVLLSHVNNPAQLWCQRDLLQLDLLMENLAEYYDTVHEECEVVDSDACVARYSEDNQWYRAQVESIYEQVVTVIFVDYGNTETTTRDKIQPLRQQFAQQPPYAIPCALHNIQPMVGDDWSEKATDSLNGLAENPMIMEIVVLPSGDDCARINLTLAESHLNIRDMLIRDKFAKEIGGDAGQAGPGTVQEEGARDGVKSAKNPSQVALHNGINEISGGDSSLINGHDGVPQDAETGTI